MSKLKTTLAVLATIAVSTSAMAATTGTLFITFFKPTPRLNSQVSAILSA